MEDHKLHQREHFDLAAHALPGTLPLRDNVMALHQLVYNRNVRRLPLRDGDRVLEPGFGWVQLIRVLEGEAAFQGVGMDLSLNMVAAAHRERGRMHFLAGDVESIPLRSGSFDSVIALSLIEHLPDQPRAIREFYRILKPGGHLLVQFPVRDDRFSWQFFYRTLFPGRFRMVLERLAHDPQLLPRSDAFRTLLRDCGFSLLWEQRDEVFFQPIYDYYILSALDRIKLWKDGRAARPARQRTAVSEHPAVLPVPRPARGPWRPRPAGIHRFLLPLASLLLLPDYLLGKCGVGAVQWMMARKK